MKLYMVMVGMKLPSFPTKGPPEIGGKIKSNMSHFETAKLAVSAQSIGSNEKGDPT